MKGVESGSGGVREACVNVRWEVEVVGPHVDVEYVLAIACAKDPLSSTSC